VFDQTLQDIENWITRATPVKIDYTVVKTIIEFAYQFALKKGELLNLCVGNVMDSSGNVTQAIHIQGTRARQVQVTPAQSQIISSYHNHLLQNDYSVRQNDALFQFKKGGGTKPYYDKKLSRDLETLQAEFIQATGINVDLKLEKIKDLGIQRYHDERVQHHMLFGRMNANDAGLQALKDAVAFAGIGLAEASMIITGAKEYMSWRRTNKPVKHSALPSELSALLQLPFDERVYFRIRDLFLEPLPVMTSQTLPNAKMVKESVFRAIDNSQRLSDHAKHVFQSDTLNLFKLRNVWFDEKGEPFMR